MTFSEIFDHDGLYQAPSFGAGFAYRIHRGQLTYVNYERPDSVEPYQEDRVSLAKYLLEYDYVKVENVKDLF
jgi:hypothetical protein